MSADRTPSHAHAGSPRRPRRGFTVVELLLAIMLLSVGMLAMAALLASSSRLQRLAASRGELATLAESKIEELRGYGQTDAADPLRARLALGGSLTSNVTSYADSVLGVNDVMYHRRWEVAAGIAGAREVRVRVLPRTTQRDHPTRFDITTLVLLQ
jgi:prepilin-type N-terminal cleavage/methylation domain-containing protein